MATTQPHKLPRLPSNTKLHKRPIQHAPIPSPYASSSVPKIVYISTKTPFMGAVTRIRKLLSHAEKRETQSERDKHREGGGRRMKMSLPGNKTMIEKKGMERRRVEEEDEGGGKAEEVVVKATGKAIERALGLAVFFQGQRDVKVRIGTGSVGVIDDIEVLEKDGRGEEGRQGGAEGKRGKKRKRDVEGVEGDENQGTAAVQEAVPIESQPSDDNTKEEEEELPESRIRFTSVIEVAISLR